MLAELLAGLEGTAFASGLRGSVWLYPLVNAAHIVGIAILFGAIVPLDLRLIGLWRDLPVEALSRVLVPMAVAGLALAALAGSMLFVTNASEYAVAPLFQAKMAVLAVALANALAFLALRRRARRHGPPSRSAQRLFAAVSLAAWLGVIVLGRLVGYF